MKKILFLFSILLAMASCSDTYIIKGTRVKTIPIYVDSSNWFYSNQPNNNYFCAYIDKLPELTEDVFDRGEVKAYLVSNRMDYDLAQKNLLPYVLHKDDGSVFYTQTIDFEYGIKWARIYYTISDFKYDGTPPSMEFDIVITYPQE